MVLGVGRWVFFSPSICSVCQSTDSTGSRGCRSSGMDFGLGSSGPNPNSSRSEQKGAAGFPHPGTSMRKNSMRKDSIFLHYLVVPAIPCCRALGFGIGGSLRSTSGNRKGRSLRFQGGSCSNFPRYYTGPAPVSIRTCWTRGILTLGICSTFTRTRGQT